MAVLDDQIAQLKNVGERRFSRVEYTAVPNGTALIKLCDFILPQGWNTATTNVYFLVPVGYPQARPDTFWTEPGLKLASGGPPVSTGTNQPLGVPANLLWFSWHPAAWNPNRDNLVTYVSMIRRRFEEKR